MGATVVCFEITVNFNMKITYVAFYFYIQLKPILFMTVWWWDSMGWFFFFLPPFINNIISIKIHEICLCLNQINKQTLQEWYKWVQLRFSCIPREPGISLFCEFYFILIKIYVCHTNKIWQLIILQNIFVNTFIF